MKLKLYLFLIISTIFLTSCAQRYGTRKGNKAIIERIEKDKKRTKKVRVARKKRGVKIKNKSSVSNKKSPKVNSPTITDKSKPNTQSLNQDVNIVVEEAYKYLGTRYKYAGSTKSGIDCSGLMCVSFSKINILLSRSAQGISEQGIEVPLDEVKIGDILCFKTIYKNRIGHVGMVVEVGDNIRFIHSSTSQGVTISSLEEPYWKKAYRFTKRIITQENKNYKTSSIDKSYILNANLMNCDDDQDCNE